jgi:hypothetical protein
MRIKKTIYILLTMFLGFLLAEIAHGLFETWLIGRLLSAGLSPQPYVFLGTHCYLPPYLQLGLLASGLVGGYFLGQTWWRIIYIEHRRWRKTA